MVAVAWLDSIFPTCRCQGCLLPYGTIRLVVLILCCGNRCGDSLPTALIANSLHSNNMTSIVRTARPIRCVLAFFELLMFGRVLLQQDEYCFTGSGPCSIAL